MLNRPFTVAILHPIPSSNEEEESFVQVEVNVSIEMSIHKLLDFLLVHLSIDSITY